MNMRETAEALAAALRSLRHHSTQSELYAAHVVADEALARYDAYQLGRAEAGSDVTTSVSASLIEDYDAGRAAARYDAERARADNLSPYAKRVRALEAEGMTTSDAQSIADVEGLEDWAC